MENRQPSPSTSVRANSLIVALSAAWWLPAAAQQNLESAYRTTGSEVVAAFEGPRAVLQTSSAVIADGRKEAGYGVVISPDGHILAKASEVLEVKSMVVTVDRTTYKGAKILMIDPTWDVALLKVDAQGLVPVNFAPSGNLPQGTWVVVNGATSRTRRRALAGIVSAKTREIPPDGGAVLGVVLNQEAKELLIDSVNEQSGAWQAGLRKGDVILKIDGKGVNKIEEVGEAMKGKKAGSVAKLTYRRGKEEATIDVRLGVRGEMFNEHLSRNDEMSGDFSPRRSGFPRVMQHDILSSRSEQGGPVLDLDGRCVGMNIARANRAESFAIPVEDLKELAERLMKQSGF